MRMALAACVALLGACSASDKLILPGGADLPLAAGDRIKLCTDDGVEDTTPTSDCVIVDRDTPAIAPYAGTLQAGGWTRVEQDPAGREVWSKAQADGACKRLLIDGEREKMTRKRYSLLRFEISAGACG